MNLACTPSFVMSRGACALTYSNRTMNYPLLITELEALAQQLGVQLRYEKGDFEGGYCVLRSQKILVINKRLAEPRKASSLAQALSEFGIETTFVKPNVRQYIEDEVARAAKGR